MRAVASSHVSSGGGVGEGQPFQTLPYTRPDASSALRGGASSSTGRGNAPLGTGDHQSVDDFVRSFDAELALLRKTGEVQRQKQQSWNATSSLSATYSAGQRYVPASNSSSSTQIDSHAYDDHRDFLGLGVQVAEGADGNVVVSSILPHGAGSQLQPGDLILSVDGHDPQSKGLAEAIRGNIVHLHVKSRNAAGIQVVPMQRTRRSPYSSQSSSTAHSGSAESQSGAQLSRSLPVPTARTFPARALMQWDYHATREDEMTAKAGEVIVITGEYKNAGWLWGSKVSAAGVATSSSLLVPANYIAYLAPTQTAPAPSNPSLPTSLSASSRPTPMHSSLSQSAPREMPTTGPPSASSLSDPPSHLTPVHSLPQSSSLGMQPAAPNPLHQPANAVSSAPSTQGQGSFTDNTPPRMAEEGDDVLEYVVGDAADPILDGMYEDESGLISINC